MSAKKPGASINQLHDVHDGTVVQAGRIDTVTVERHVHQVSASDDVSRWVFGTVPPRVRAFQDREIAAELAAVVANDRTTILAGVGSRVVSGLGGVGKTQLAAEHARHLWHDRALDVLMWVTATSRDAILSSYAQAVAVVDNGAGLDAERAAGRWLGWLTATEKRWLVVLDDIQDPADIVGLWPPHTPTGRVVATTRRRDAALISDGRRIVEVGLFTPRESLTFLTQRLTRRPAQTDGAEQLANQLGHLPVALAQAAAYIADRPALTCASYLRRWTDRRKTLSAVFPAKGELPDEHRETLATTWSLSIDLANDLNPVGLARPLLEIASLLNPNGVPASVFTTPAILTHLETCTGGDVAPEDAVDALSCLQRFSLITNEPDTPHRAVRVHALVQRATREIIDADWLNTCARAAADALNEAWPDVERDTDLSAILRTNAEALRTTAAEPLLEPNVHAVLFLAGNSLGNAGQVQAAADYYRQLHTTIENSLGVDHPDSLSIRNDLAWWQGKSGDSAGAIAAFEQLLTDCGRMLGTDHPQTLTARANHARWRGKAGDAAGAAETLKRVLADQGRVLGFDHPSTLLTGNDLAWWCGAAGDAVGAVVELDHVLADTERVLGIHHPHTILARHSLGWWHGVAGDPVGAVTELQQVLADTERVLGIHHPESLAMRHSLAWWQSQAGDTPSAAAAFKQLLTDRERILGPDHPDTLSTRNELTRLQAASKDACTRLQGTAQSCSPGVINITLCSEQWECSCAVSCNPFGSCGDVGEPGDSKRADCGVP